MYIKGNRILIKLFTGLLSILAGITIYIIKPNKLYRQGKLTFSEGGEVFGLWLKPTIEPHFKVYVFNVTNKDAFLEGKEKLRVEEAGPYIYRSINRNLNPVFNHDDGTVTTSPLCAFEWVPELNTRNESDVVTMPNLSMLLMAQYFSDKIGLVKMVTNTYMANTGISAITNVTVKDILFGINDPLVNLGHTFLPHWIDFDKLGIFDRICNISSDKSTTYTGEKDYSTGGQLATYNKLSYLKHLPKSCSNIKGATDGKKFGNDILPNQTLYFYQKTFCRAFPLVNVGPEITNEDGLPAVPYKIREDALDNGETNPENKCYCRETGCLPNGLSDAADCFYGLSAAFSYPHFFRGDPSLLEKIDGVKPNSSLHDSVIYLNTQTGIMTNLSMKFQFNLVLDNISDMYGCEKFSNMVVPIMWAEMMFSSLGSDITMKIYLTLRVFPIAEKVLIAILVILGSAVVICQLAAMRRTNENKFGLNESKIEYAPQEKEDTANEHKEEQCLSSLLTPSERV